MEDITVKSNLKSVLNPGLGGLEAKQAPGAPAADGASFIETLSESIQKVNELQKEADQAIENLATGESNSVHGAMIAVSKADTAFRLTMQVRNKMVEAYQEVMRMQV